MTHFSRRRISIAAAAILSIVSLPVACRSSAETSSIAAVESAKPRVAPLLALDERGEPLGIEHFKKWSDKITQGGEPVGERAFENLAALGIRTIVSVDGAAPDVDTAARFGLRYVHVPIGYDGITRDAALGIVKAALESDGPVYFHCHHGLHRGPAAAAIARIAADGVGNAEALDGLNASGCSPKYQGLFRDVGAFAAPTPAELAAAPAPKSRVVPSGTRGVMSFVDRRWDAINASKAAAWSVPASMPDIDPAHEVVMVENSFRDLIQREERKKAPDARYLALLGDARSASEDLESALRALDAAKAETAYAQLKAACDACHTEYRN
jgi:protein tyrosine phosphatase (PTP) superfamily phosphohydrolase (DUF442 family)